MSDSSRGGVAVLIIIIAVAAYYFLWIHEPSGGASTAGQGGGGNYLQTQPEIPEKSPMKKGETAPDFKYLTIEGEEIQLSQYVGKKPVVLDFWATWCGPCMMELPKLQEFYEKHSGDVEIIAITSEKAEEAGKVVKTVQDKGLNFKIMHDPSRAISSLFPTRGIPFLVFIDEDGIVVDTATGYDPNVADEIMHVFGM